MAARIRKQHQDEVRAKIRASQLVNRLTDHALGNLEKPMDASQVTAALGLLKKCVSDLSSVDHTGEILHRNAREMSDDDLANIASGSSEGTSEAQDGPEEPANLH